MRRRPYSRDVQSSRSVRKALTIEETLALLEEHPRRIAAATAGVSPARLRSVPVVGTWSARDVLAHLRACSDARGVFTQTMLAAGKPTLRAIDPRALLEPSGYLAL